MQRVLDPAQIEGFAQGQRTLPRIRLPNPSQLFLQRATRLRQLSHGHAVSGYLRLMAALSDAQHRALTQLLRDSKVAELVQPQSSAGEHGMPLLQAAGSPRAALWRVLLNELCAEIAALPDFPEAVAATCEAIRAYRPEELDLQADLLLTPDSDGIDTRIAPFLMAALQIYWVASVCSLAPDTVAAHVGTVDVPGVCPVCGTLPVASIVRAEKAFQGYRYLHCALCSTEWHLVRVKCSQCLGTEGIHYHSIAGEDEKAPAAVRAEACDACRTYRKICYQEHDTTVEPVAEDLASLALDLLMTEAGFHRGSGNPLLWHSETT